jgi:hypothetical protein
MTFYWHGALALDDRLLARFYTKASVELRSHAMRFIGQSLREAETVAGDVINRLKALWESRLRATKHNQRPASELTEFGWWFVSDKFDEDWALGQLQNALRNAGKIEPDFMVAQKLAEIAKRMPSLSVECLELMVESDREGWGIHGWEHEAREVLEAALRSSDRSVAQKAETIIHRLGARGHMGFRELLKRAK